MPDDRGTLREVAWTQLFPWLDLLRAFRLAIQARFLALATVALLLTIGGWWILGTLFAGSGDPQVQSWITAYGQGPWSDLPPDVAAAEMRAAPLGVAGPEAVLYGPAHMTGPTENPLLSAWHSLTGPFRQLFEPQLSLAGLAFLLLCGLWVDIVWAFFGGVITRLVALQLARSERGSLRTAMRHVRSRYHAYLTAPLFPLFGVLLFSLPLAAVGLIGRAGAPGLVVVALLWPLFLIAGLAITIFLIGLLFGWPLMWPTISAEGTDSFDALSRSYSYVFQRPLHYFWYVVVAGVLSLLGWIVVRLFASALLYLTAWAVSWGAGGIILSGPALAEAAPWAAKMLSFWSALVQLFAVSFVYTFFLTASTIAYFLLRYQVDGTEMDEVYVEGGAEKFGLPAVTVDAAGVPLVADETADKDAADVGDLTT